MSRPSDDDDNAELAPALTVSSEPRESPVPVRGFTKMINNHLSDMCFTLKRVSRRGF